MEGTDRIVFLINQTAIRERERLQKYGFLAYQLYGDDLAPLGFYSDWEAYDHGPYSMDLTCDLQQAEKTGLIKIESGEFGGRAVDFYSLAPKGAKRLSSLLHDHGDLVGRIHETLASLNKKPLDRLIGEIYADYPQYAKNGGIKGRVTDEDPEDARFSPETERMIHEIESGNADWERHSIEEHIQYIDRLMKE